MTTSPHPHSDATSIPGGRPPRPPAQLADPAVSEAKFEWELSHFLESEPAQRERGILLIRADYPEVLLAFAATRVHPTPVVFGALLDYTDYDHTPPSLRLVDAFTERPYEAGELPLQLLRRTVTLGDGGGGNRQVEIVPLVRAEDRLPPLVYLPGTRDYYDHPGNNRDSWLLHRHRDVGSLESIAEQLYSYGLGEFTTNQGVSAAQSVRSEDGAVPGQGGGGLNPA